MAAPSGGSGAPSLSKVLKTLLAKLGGKRERAGCSGGRDGAVLGTQGIRQSLPTAKMLLQLGSSFRKQFMTKQGLALPIGAKKPKVSVSYAQNAPSPLPPPKSSRRRYCSSSDLCTCKSWAFPWVGEAVSVALRNSQSRRRHFHMLDESKKSVRAPQTQRALETEVAPTARQNYAPLVPLNSPGRTQSLRSLGER